MNTGISAYRKQRNYGCRVHDQYTYMGMRTVVLENETLRVSILVDKGTDVYEFLYKPLDLDYMWITERGVHPPHRYLPTSPDPISTFIDYYEGGWQEVFPNGGPTSSHQGAVYGQHGEVAHMPWDYAIEEDTPERVAVRFEVRTKKAPYSLRKRMILESGRTALIVEEEVVNEGASELRYMWGQHLAYGKPFAGPGSRIRLPAGVEAETERPDADSGPGRVKRGVRHVWPNAVDEAGRAVDLSVLPPVGTASDIVYLTGFGKEAWYEIESPDRGAGLRVEWDGEAMPYLWFWQEFGATTGYPWYGRHYNIGLEPFCGYPTRGLEEAARNGSAGRIGPGETRSLRMELKPYRV
ncbi:DUF4432 family protein [Paenibacillus antri]|uniref:DUF4432 family protein n=1 Tax=Paenibacillus antri TaxID=2582848 RepID=A0A5R9G134_9BACL|nr:DUF4432 family protein [Paenibacillus antri]TLS48719.1 DUF4432 family protein [Paenibacillus antri]